MRYRIYFALVTLFFIAMNVLLWRSEFSAQGRFSSPVPAAVVWQKILTAPDNSRLAIEWGGKKIGYCTWAPNLSQALATGKTMIEDVPPEGMIEQVSGYTLDLDGSVSVDHQARVRFNLRLAFTTNQVLEELVATVKVRPDVWELRFSPAKQVLHLEREVDHQRSTRRYKLSRPRHWERLLTDLGLPLPPGALSGLGLEPEATRFDPAALGLEWTTRNDWLQFSNARFRVYRIEARFLRQYHAVIYVSHIGEILRVELPRQLVLSNDALIGLK